MKNYKSKIKNVVALCAVALAILIHQPSTAAAQSTNVDQGFFGSVTGYLTSFNPELEGSLASHAGLFWSGAQWQAGAHISSSIGLSYKVYKNISVESESRFADVTGLVDTQQFGVGYNVDVHDVRLTGFLRGVYEFEKDRASASLGVRALKLMTTHTASFISLEVPIERGNRPVLSLGLAILF